MGIIVLPNTIQSGDSDNPTRDMANWTTILNEFNGNIDNDNIASNAAIAISKTALTTYTTPTAYSPTWTASTPPAIGNGTLTGRYFQIGKQVVYYVSLTMGGTTTYGSGEWTFSLPVTAATTVNNVGSAYILDSGTAYYIGSTLTASSTTLKIFGYNTGGAFSSSVPHTWATSDNLVFTHIYEAA